MNLPIIATTESSPELRENLVTKAEVSGSSQAKTNLFKKERIRFQKIVRQMRSSESFEALLNNAVAAIQQELQASRLLIYRFDNNQTGRAIAEAMNSDWIPMLNEVISCNLFGRKQAVEYGKRDFTLIGKGTNNSPTPHQQKLLDDFQIISSLALPIFIHSNGTDLNKMWGLLVAQQCDHSRQWQEEEINLLERISAEITIALHQTQPLIKLGQQQPNLITKIEKDVSQLIKETLPQIRQSFQADRVWIYSFNPDGSGKVLAESVDSQWQRATSSLDNDCFLTSDNYQPYYVVNDIHTQGLAPCLVAGLEAQQAKAYIAVPIVVGKQLLGILAIFQNSSPRNWLESEVKRARKYASQFSSPLEQLTFILNSQFQTQEIEKFSQSNFLSSINQQARKSMQKMAHNIRQLLQGDRVLVYGYNPDGSGAVLGESVDSQWQPAGAVFDRDYHLKPDCEAFFVVDDIYAQGFTRCFIEALEALEAKAYIAVPIRQGKQLLGVLSVYQNSAPRNWQKSEVEFMVQSAAKLSLPLRQTAYLRHTQFRLHQSQKFLAREQGLTRILERIRSAQHKENVFQIATQEGRKLMEVDRLAIYRFEPDWSGKFIAESVAAGWSKLIDTILVVQDTFLQETEGGRYKHGDCFVVDDIYTIGHQDCHIQLLEQFEARAYMIAPIFAAKKKLWGLIAAYQNTGSRKWQSEETEALRQLGLQVGIAMEQIEYVEQLESRTQELANSNERETSIIKFSGELIQRLAELSRKNLNVNAILEFATQELRQVLKADRVVIYHFNTDWSGKFIVESINDNCRKLVGTELAKVENTYFQESKGSRYSQGESVVINDISQANRQDFSLELSEQFNTQAYVITPIFLGNKLWGLLRVYQHDTPRHWKDSELAVIEQVSTQIGIILQLGKYLIQLRSQEQKVTEAAEREKAKREQFQQSALKVLSALQPSFQGDLTVRAPLSEDEIGTIADGYNTTIVSLRELVRQVQIAARGVGDTCDTSTHSVDELSNQAQQQVERLEVALGELISMVASTEAVSSNAQKVEQALEEANQMVNNGDMLMEQTVDSILEMRDTVSETAKKIKRLGEASQRISKVVNLIDNFATQTNLLSLNAAIEATRAGEYGKGFAVVADEVRNLAYQSANATTEIERLVEEIQTEISAVTEVMEVGISQVVQGSELVDKTRHSLSEIVTVTNQISGLVEGITQATKIQNQQSQSLTEAMHDVSNLANQTLTSSTQISQSFQKLLHTSEELQTSVSQFKVD